MQISTLLFPNSNHVLSRLLDTFPTHISLAYHIFAMNEWNVYITVKLCYLFFGFFVWFFFPNKWWQRMKYLMQFVKITCMPITTFLRAGAVYKTSANGSLTWKEADKLPASGLKLDPDLMLAKYCHHIQPDCSTILVSVQIYLEQSSALRI